MADQEEREREKRENQGKIKESPVFAEISSVQSGRNITRGILAEILNFSRFWPESRSNEKELPTSGNPSGLTVSIDIYVCLDSSKL